MNKPVLFIYRKMKEDNKVSRAKNPKYESMSLEELKANMEKSRQELEAAIHNKNILEQEEFQEVMNQMRNSSYRISDGRVFSEAWSKVYRIIRQCGYL